MVYYFILDNVRVSGMILFTEELELDSRRI